MVVKWDLVFLKIFIYGFVEFYFYIMDCVRLMMENNKVIDNWLLNKKFML